MPNWVATNLYIRGKKEDLQKVKENLLVTDEWRKEVAERNAKVTPKMVVNGKAIGTKKVKDFRIKCNEDDYPLGTLDFNRIVPTPLNIFQGNIGIKERKRYGDENCWLDWCMANWGTKWNTTENMAEDIDEETIFVRFWVANVFPKALMEEFNKRCLEYNCTIDGEFADEDLGGTMGIFHSEDEGLYLTFADCDTELYNNVWHDDECEPIMGYDTIVSRSVKVR